MSVMLPDHPPRHGGDDRFCFLLGNANPELWATTTPLVVIHRCQRHKGLVATWRAIHWLIVLHSRSGKADFGVREIAEEADVGRNELCDSHDRETGALVKKGYITLLREAGLIDVVGQVAIPGGRKPRNIYSVDLARLIAESAHLAPEILRAYGADAPPRPQVHPDQLTFFGLMEQEASRTGHDTGSGVNQVRPEDGTVRDRHLTRYPHIGPGASQARPENGTDPVQLSEQRPENGTLLPPQAQRYPENGPVARPHSGLRPENMTGFVGDRPGIGTGVPLLHPDSTPLRDGGAENGTDGGPDLSRIRDVGGMGGWGDGRMDGREGGAHALAPRLRDLIYDTIHEALAHLGLGSTFTPATSTLPPTETIPAPPPGELTLDAGPLTTWIDLCGRAATPADVAKIKETVRRFDRASGGHAGYWLARAMACVALEEQAPLTISYASGILRRMQERQDWSTEELHRRAKEQRATAESPAARPQPPRKPREDQAPRRQEQPAAEPLPADMEQHWVIVAWRQRAGAAVAITPARAQQLVAQVTDRASWEAVLTNWHAQYQRRPGGPNWAHLDGLLERYDREVAAGRAASRPADAPHIPGTVLDLHPALQHPELSRIWHGRYAEATGKAARQAVLLDLLREHPLPNEMLRDLQIPPLPALEIKES